MKYSFGNKFNIVFLEDDTLDFLVYQQALKEVVQDANIIRLEQINSSFYSKYAAENTIIFLDLLIGKRDGLELFNESLSKAGYQVYVLSSSDNPKDISRCQIAGLNGYFQKKSGLKEIIVQMSAILNFANYNLLPGSLDNEREGVKLMKELKEMKLHGRDLESQISLLRNNQLYPDPEHKDPNRAREMDKLFVKIASSYTSGIYIYTHC